MAGRTAGRLLSILIVSAMAFSMALLSACSPGAEGESDAADQGAAIEAAVLEEGSRGEEGGTVDGADASSGISAQELHDITMNDLDDAVKLSAEEAQELLSNDKGIYVVDIRYRRAFGAGHIKGAVNVAPGVSLELRADDFPEEVPILLVTTGDYRLAESWQRLVDSGIGPSRVFVLEGGIEAWVGAGLPTETSDVIPC